jgi:8-amino-7-oxononanoate synthase
VRDFSATLQDELDRLRSANRLRSCPELAGASRARPLSTSGPVLSFCSNDYLGLAWHPDVLAAARATAEQEGFGAGAARLVSGDLPAHRALERDLAEFTRRPSCLLFATGYQANLGVVTALAGPDDLIVSDAANHASLIDGCRLSRATVRVFAHADTSAAAVALASVGPFRRRLLITESLFSMDGDAAPLTALAALATAHDAILIVDEAHALGTMGPGGRGLCAEASVEPDVLIGTLGKSFGAAGGFVAGADALRAFLVNKARPFIFATAPPPPVAAAARAALRLATTDEGDHRRVRLQANRAALAGALTALGRSTATVGGPIIPVVLGTDADALEASAHLLEQGLYVAAIRPPTVPEGTARLRVTLSSEHAPADVERLANALAGLPP